MIKEFPLIGKAEKGDMMVFDSKTDCVKKAKYHRIPHKQYSTMLCKVDKKMLIDNSLEREKIPVYHKECNGIAFYSLGKFSIGEAMKASRVILSTGEKAKPGDHIICGNCRKKSLGGWVKDLEYRDA